MSEREDFSRLSQDGALRHLDVTSGLQVVAQELDGVDQFVKAAREEVILEGGVVSRIRKCLFNATLIGKYPILALYPKFA